MISKINLNKVASYKSPTFLATDKKINLIYGLNGAGKSVLSTFLYKISALEYKDCSIDGLGPDDEILVYNQKFIQEIFFESENLNGIFTLSKANKDAELKISEAEKEIKRIEEQKRNKESELEKANNDIAAKQLKAKNKVWEVKTNYSGGDRVLEFCLEGYKSDGNKLLSFVEALKKPEFKPAKLIVELREEVQALAGDNAQKYSLLPKTIFPQEYIEKDIIFKKQIVGNENSTVAVFISELGSSDWVKAGLKYLQENIIGTNEKCPFCQELTISNELIRGIKEYFDESYEKDLKQLNDFLNEYVEGIDAIPDISVYEANPKLDSYKKDFELKYNSLVKIYTDNKKLIEDKIKTPSIPVSLKDSKTALQDLLDIIDSVNKLTQEHNSKIDNKEKAFKDIKTIFWNIIRWEYDHSIAEFILQKIK